MNIARSFILIIVGALLMARCIEPFNPPASSSNVNYLVVDGFLNASEGSCTLKLTRTVPLTSPDDAIPIETNAVVEIHDELGNTLSLHEVDTIPGTYAFVGQAIDVTKKYKLQIKTSDNAQFESSFVSVNRSPEIDSVSWPKRDDRNGLAINVNTHDPLNSTHFYSWAFTETFEYLSKYPAYYTFLPGTDSVVALTENITFCYTTDYSSRILVATSNALNIDQISEFELTKIPWTSRKIGFKYSILVKQSALSKEAFDYWQAVKKNTEELGTLFAPLPSTVTGNIKCTTDDSKAVIGFFTASTVTTKRKFIGVSEIIKYKTGITVTGYEGCSPLDSIMIGEDFHGLYPVGSITQGITILGYTAAPQSCIDCRFAGGVNVKPDFWP